MAVIKIGAKKTPKREKKPDEILFEEYKKKLAYWEQKRKEAVERDDFSARNIAIAQCQIMEGQIAELDKILNKGKYVYKRARKEEDYE